MRPSMSVIGLSAAQARAPSEISAVVTRKPWAARSCTIVPDNSRTMSGSTVWRERLHCKIAHRMSNRRRALAAADARLHASIRKAFHQGVPVADLARAASVERSTIYRWVKQ